ncbi:MAG: GNAT family N-acetyltransferase [Bacteroidales bacterium]|nr:GNAT family N-acetyltransferase [Bacteroidales bacterium]
MQVIIRPLQEQDAYTSVQWRNDPEVFKYTGNTYDHEITIESELGWIRKVIANPNDYRCAILVDGVYIGNIYLTDIDGYSAHYHIFIGNKDYWGKGVAKKASQLILDYAFNKLGLKIVKLKVRKENISAVKLYEKLCFKAVEEDGKWIVMEKQNIIDY